MSSGLGLWLQNQFYKKLVGSVFPVSWFAPKAPRLEDLSVPDGKLHIQIVSHSWQYAHLSQFQLSSLVNFPPGNCTVTYTLFHAAEDAPMLELIKRFDALQVPNLIWDWQVLPREELFRRAIGRHRAAISSHADWLWFVDCDLIFHKGCIDSLADSLAGRQELLAYPDHEGVTELLSAEHPMLNQSIGESGTVDIDPELFDRVDINKAKGTYQVVHGDVARVAGYCGTLSVYQRPTAVWRKTFEDTVFRRLIETEGVAVPVKNLYRIRHAEKGRYAKGTAWSGLRGKIRKLFD